MWGGKMKWEEGGAYLDSCKSITINLVRSKETTALKQIKIGGHTVTLCHGEAAAASEARDSRRRLWMRGIRPKAPAG